MSRQTPQVFYGDIRSNAKVLARLNACMPLCLAGTGHNFCGRPNVLCKQLPPLMFWPEPRNYIECKDFEYSRRSIANIFSTHCVASLAPNKIRVYNFEIPNPSLLETPSMSLEICFRDAAPANAIVRDSSLSRMFRTVSTPCCPL